MDTSGILNPLSHSGNSACFLLWWDKMRGWNGCCPSYVIKIPGDEGGHRHYFPIILPLKVKLQICLRTVLYLPLLIELLVSNSLSLFWLGPSAWQNWTYEVKVSTQDFPETTYVFCNISGTILNVHDLQSATKYKVSVRASSPKGPGPWSEPSVGTTLVPGEKMFGI